MGVSQSAFDITAILLMGSDLSYGISDAKHFALTTYLSSFILQLGGLTSLSNNNDKIEYLRDLIVYHTAFLFVYSFINSL